MPLRAGTDYPAMIGAYLQAAVGWMRLVDAWQRGYAPVPADLEARRAHIELGAQALALCYEAGDPEQDYWLAVAASTTAAAQGALLTRAAAEWSAQVGKEQGGKP